MALIFISALDDAAAWRTHLQAAEPSLEVRVWPEIGNPRDIEAALVWKPPPGELRRFERLKLIVNLGAGVDSIVADATLPPGVPIARIADPELTRMMSQFALLAVMRHHRELPSFERAQARGEWLYIHPKETRERSVGVLGLGHLGSGVAEELVRQGFRVLGWSRRQRRIDGVECHAGRDGLPEVLAKSEMLVSLLPLTADTLHLLDAERLALLPHGARFINLGRGRVVDEPALIEALRSGRIAEATLDVFHTEPLPAGHPFWTLPQVLVTPHIASVVAPRSSAAQVVENMRRARAGEPILHRVDVARGY